MLGNLKTTVSTVQPPLLVFSITPYLPLQECSSPPSFLYTSHPSSTPNSSIDLSIPSSLPPLHQQYARVAESTRASTTGDLARYYYQFLLLLLLLLPQWFIVIMIIIVIITMWTFPDQHGPTHQHYPTTGPQWKQKNTRKPAEKQCPREWVTDLIVFHSWPMFIF